MKKLLFVNTDMCAGGIEVSLINLLKNIDYSRYDVSVLLLTQNLEFLDRIPHNCRVIIVSRNDKEYKGAGLYKYVQNLYAKKRNIFEKVLLKVVRPLEEELFARYVASKMRHEQFDTAISYRVSISADVTLKSIKAKRKIVFYHQGNVVHFRNENEWYTKFDNVVTVSKGIKNEMQQTYPYIKDKLSVVHNLLDIEHIRKSGKAPYTIKKTDECITIVSVGRLVEDKGFDMLIKACSKLKQAGYNIKLILVGGSDLTHYDKTLLKIAYDYGMEKDIIWTGSQSNPYSIMSRADIYVQSSRVEAFGITIREAQILGLPIVATATYGANEIIEENVTGILCDISVEGLFNGIKSLADNEALREILSQNCLNIDYEKMNQNEIEKFYRIIENE